ncbi:hypothetical protein PtA15_10A729 [Puccinia triticina]|uniref:Uncharacterized protein n=1 Tax=Puccinia triticina TaxID=208348 RepID=A0ABY7CWF8_9BASI|nr:uncharacterized protein PtA15_10A729 [Puccinia triticina]WAQ89305.1 hypothetical protein PtA15_10A729 [Puccinia triticina]WAR59354.1 hypothetical protein PtB15_10B696 [Puccinia triticina]
MTPELDMWKIHPWAHLLALGTVCLLARLIFAGHEFLCSEPGPYHTLDGLDLSQEGPSCSIGQSESFLGRAVRQHRLSHSADPTWQSRRVRQKVSNPLEHVRPTDFPIPFINLVQHDIRNPAQPHQLSTHPLPLEVAVVLSHQDEEPQRIGLNFDLNHTPPSSPPEHVPVEHVPGEHVPVGPAAPLEHIAEQVVSDEQPAQAHPEVDSDSLDMHESIPQDFTPILRYVQMAVVHPELLIKYHTPLKEHINSHPAKFATGMSNKPTERVGNLPVYFEPCLSGTFETMFAPRIAKLSKPKPSAGKNRGIYQSPSMISALLGNLIKCILFAHGAFFRQINSPVEEQIRKHDSLMRWLNDLVFSTTNHLPIFGAISRSEFLSLREKGYTPAQKHVIHYLRGRSDDPSLEFFNDFAALSLIGIWYKREAPVEWAQHFQGSESTFWLRMRQSMEDAKENKSWKSGKWVEQVLAHQKPDAEMNDFDLLGLQHGINPQGPSRWRAEKNFWLVNRKKYEPSEVEDRIIMEHRRVLKLVALKRTGKPSKTITAVRAKLHDAVENATGEEIWIVRVIDIMSRPQTTESVETKLATLLEGLWQHHQTLISYMEHSNIQSILNAHDAFLDWFSETILSPSTGPLHLPLFGYVYKSQPGEVEPPLDETRFNPIQHRVLRNIAIPDKNRTTFDVLTLLGYWYKKHQPDYWQVHFKTEGNFGALFKHANNPM